MRWIAIAAGFAVAIMLVAIAADPRSPLSAWLTAMLVVSMLPAGALALLLTWHLHRGHWGIVLGPAMHAAVAATPVAALLMLPLLLFAGTVYPWAEQAGPHVSPWLSQPAFALRGIVYLALWCLLAHLATRDGPPTDAAPRRPALASAGLIVYALTASFAGIDWVLSLQPTVFSSVFGMIFVAHQMLGAFGFLLLVGLPVRAGDVRGVGAMLFGGLMLWLYLEYMQYLIVWSGDLPGHHEFYLARLSGGWTGLVGALAVAGGAVPFVLLLSSRLRGDAAVLRQLGLLFVLSRIAEAAWWVMPVVEQDVALPALVAVALVGGGGMWLAAWRWCLDRAPTEAPAHG